LAVQNIYAGNSFYCKINKFVISSKIEFALKKESLL